jgi:sporulation protein YhbH
MLAKIEQDRSRFRHIVQGQVKQNLRKYMSDGELIGRQGKDYVSIPVPQIELPSFRFGRNQGGVGQGDGAPGTPLGGDGEMDGEGQAGNQAGQHILEVELTLAELAAILAQELELPHIEPKGKRNIRTEVDRYVGIRRVGPESLRHFKRTYREALKRQIALAAYDVSNPKIIPIREDKRYRSWQERPLPESNAVVLYMMDVSGSMTQAKKEIVRLTAFWIDTWLHSQYENVRTRYIIHDATAREVDQRAFYTTRESGGTVISSAYELCLDMINRDYNPDEWNIYPFHFSDGENWSKEDDQKCASLLAEHMLPKVNLFCYGQVKGSYGDGQFIRVVDGIEGHDNISTAEIDERDHIYDAIKTFLGKGR